MKRLLRKLWVVNSMRMRALAVVCAVVVIPVLFVWAMSPLEDALGYQMRQSVMQSTLEASSLVKMDAPEAEYQQHASTYDVWLRAVDEAGDVFVDANGIDAPGLREWLLFVPNPVPVASDWDATQPPVAQRTIVATVMEDGEARGECFVTKGGTLQICVYARRVAVPGFLSPRVLYSVIASPRAISSLYDDRYQVTKLTLLVLLIAVAFGLWLGWRIGKPLDRLRQEVLERTAPIVSTTPIEVQGDDEFAELGRAFNALLAALEARNRSNEAFMADMAHEVKNPVAAIRAAAESLERKELSPERAARIARVLKDSGRRLDTVVNNFLELARAESGLPKTGRKEIRLDELVRNLVETYSADPRAEAISLTTDVQRVEVDGAAEALETAVRNLVQNALSFAEHEVHVRVFRDGDDAVVHVVDDGPGIHADDLDRVFERFFTRRDDGGGTDLGLAMVRAIARAHGGVVTAVSTPGEGATFVFRIPALTGLDT